MNTYHHVNSLKKLEELLELSYDIPNREAFDTFIFRHPLRFTPYLLRQIKQFPSVAKQYVPDPRELEPAGIQKPFTGVISTGVPGLERMYIDRVILMPSAQCFAYCRFCFRKNYSHDARDEDYGNVQNDFSEAIDYIRSDERIKEVLITGGDPLMFPEKVIELCRSLRTIPHLTSIRIGTRIFTSDPELIDETWIRPFAELNTVTKYDEAIPAPISISPHINHPDELSPETTRSLLLCTQNRIPLYNQTVLLKGLNDDSQTLIELNRQLRRLGVEPYRIYHADPLQGTNYLRTRIEDTIRIKQEMRSQVSGRVVPDFILETTIGKVDVSDVSIADRKDHVLTIKTPYTLNIYRSMDPSWELPNTCSLDTDGFILAEYEDATVASDRRTRRLDHSEVSQKKPFQFLESQQDCDLSVPPVEQPKSCSR